MIEIDRLSVAYGPTVVLEEVSLEIGRGEWVAVVGPNGAGKTTLLRAAAELQAHAGEVRIGGEAMSALSPRERSRRLAYLPQSPELPADMTALEYVLLGRTPYISYLGSESHHDVEVSREVLARLGLEGFEERKLGSLSGGERQRAVLGRALSQDAPVLILDEPTSALDLGRRMDALFLVDELRRERDLTLLVALHDLTLAGQFADRIVLVSAGHVVAEGRPEEVFEESLLSDHFGGGVRVLVTEDGDLVVVPRGRARARRGG